MKLAFIDLDGVTADCTERLKQADIVKMKFLDDAWDVTEITVDGVPREVEIIDDKLPDWVKKEAEKRYWNTVFTPELVDLDTPLPGVKEDLERVELKCYRTIYLSSRPESMRAATEAWLKKHDLDVDAARFKRELILKCPAFQFVKNSTVVWKTGMVQQFAALFEAKHVLVVDDQQNIINAIIEAQIKNVSVMHYGLLAVGSLPEAIKKLGE